MLKKNLKGITLLESFLAAFIFVTSVAAIFVTMNALRKPAMNNETALNGALVLRNFLENLRSKVDSRNFSAFSSANPTNQIYSTGDLTSGAHDGPSNVGGLYNIYYNVSVDSSTKAIKVNAKVNWPDAL